MSILQAAKPERRHAPAHHSPETKEKLRQYRLGKKHDAAAKAKISAAIKRTRANRRGELGPSWKGGITIDKSGYRLALSPNHPFAVGGYVPEHRLVVERTLGRFLAPKEIIHHINGNRADNRRENLLICNRAYHRWLHGKKFKGEKNGYSTTR